MEADSNNSNNQNLKENFFSKIKLVHDYFISKNKKETDDSNINVIKTNFNDLKVKESNIYIKYLNNPDIIFQEKGDRNNENLKLLFKELDSDIKIENNILFPFLDLFPNLIKAYINSDLDDINFGEKESVSNSYYLKLFSQLKCNLFINKEILFPIYDYFSNLYDMVTEAQQGDLKKLKKIFELFKIFYDINILNRNTSSFCLLGGNLDITFNKPFQINDLEIEIEIRFLNHDFIEYINDDFYICKINENLIKYGELKKNFDNQRLESIIITINQNLINSKFNLAETNFSLTRKVQIDEIETISLLEGFYGQVSLIGISITKESKITKYKFFPISIRNGNTIFHIKKKVNENISCEYIPKITISDKNLVKVNYINYNNKIFNIINYFGGIIQFLPFYQIFKKLLQAPYTSKNEANKSDSINKSEISDFIYFLVKIMIKQLFSIKNNVDLYNKYISFVYSLLLNIDFDLIISLDDLVENEDQRKTKSYFYIDLLIMIYFNQKNQPNYTEKDIHEFLKNIKADLSFFKRPLKKFNQIYRKYMKQLFCFNGFWSKRNIFFPERYKDLNPTSKQIKYKQINYYTKNFQLPFYCPILEYKNYYPNFSRFNSKLFKESDDKILKYDFKLEPNEESKIIIGALIPKRNDDNSIEKCCLVKNTHHVRGELSIIKMEKKSNKNFKLYFKQKGQENCNKVERVKRQKGFKVNNQGNSNTPESDTICYGAIFSCPKREKGRRITINSSDILFLMIRVYYHSVSAIEIFTINKSYYFNFKKEFKKKSNKILNEFINNPFFKEIKIEKDKIAIGYYNTKYKPYLFPLFEDKIADWEKKIDFFCNYDILMLINLFSNRSHRDVFQYPIFPTIFNIINLKRNMGAHIGFQEIDKDSLKRRDILLHTYTSNLEDCDTEMEICLFNIHYSNPAFVFNYLLRVFPYSFLAIEFQGDNFDDPNRLFNSIEKLLISSCSIKSDLREMIPELFYMFELFYNKNNILFKLPESGKPIDYVIIKEEENISSHIKKMENYANYICLMRKNLEEEKNINQWIDLIFGINQRYYELNSEFRFQYYEKSSEISFKTDQDKSKDLLELDRINFGLLPYQLFKEEFPIIEKKGNLKLIESLKNFNKNLFDDEHINVVNSPMQTFICKGKFLINEEYVNLVNNNEKLNILENYFNIPSKLTKKQNLSEINYNIFKNLFFFVFESQPYLFQLKKGFNNFYFVGDIFGCILIYYVKAKERKNNNIEEENLEKEGENEKIESFGTRESIQAQSETVSSSIKETEIKRKSNYYNFIDNNSKVEDNCNLECKFYKKLFDHTQEIKYIDFNQRLNVLLSYSLDEFINIYILPKFKLINVIDSKSFKKENDNNIFEEVVLLSYPFPSIVCHNKDYIYLLSINGELIKYEKLEEGDKVSYSIDKNYSIVEDEVRVINSKNELKYVFNFFDNK